MLKAERRIVDLYNKIKNLPSGGGDGQVPSLQAVKEVELFINTNKTQVNTKDSTSTEPSLPPLRGNK